ncbi:MAG: Maf family protein [Phycisphaerales bacterium]
MKQENPSTADSPGRASPAGGARVKWSPAPGASCSNATGTSSRSSRPGSVDGQLTRGESTSKEGPRRWRTSARSRSRVGGLALARGRGHRADTICVKDGRLFGQPADERDAERTIRLLSGGTHEVLTGVALICPKRAKRMTFCDRSVVTVGELTEDQIESYLASGEWRGKAGAYNLYERIAAGWPIEFKGDPTSIMGLPMRALGDRLARFCDAA